MVTIVGPNGERRERSIVDILDRQLASPSALDSEGRALLTWLRREFARDAVKIRTASSENQVGT